MQDPFDDPGAIGVNRLREKNVTLAISREVEAMINAMPGYRAVMLRDGDYYVGLRERTQLGHKHNADLYIASRRALSLTDGPATAISSCW